MKLPALVWAFGLVCRASTLVASAPAIDECPTLRCGPSFQFSGLLRVAQGCSCQTVEAPYCNENNGWCGSTASHRTVGGKFDYAESKGVVNGGVESDTWRGMEDVQAIAGQDNPCPRPYTACSQRMDAPIVYYINCDKDVGRRRIFERDFANVVGVNTSIARIPCIYHGGRLDPMVHRLAHPEKAKQMFETIKQRLPNKKEPVILNELGCTLSHMVAVETVALGDAPWAVVMEDDMSSSMVRTWTAPLSTLINSLPESWGVLKISFSSLEGTQLDLLDYWQGESAIKSSAMWHTWGTTAYVLRKTAASAFLEKQPWIVGETLPTGRRHYTFDPLALPDFPCIVADDCFFHSGWMIHRKHSYESFTATPMLLTWADGRSARASKMLGTGSTITQVQEHDQVRLSRLAALDWSATKFRACAARGKAFSSTGKPIDCSNTKVRLTEFVKKAQTNSERGSSVSTSGCEGLAPVKYYFDLGSNRGDTIKTFYAAPDRGMAAPADSNGFSTNSEWRFPIVDYTPADWRVFAFEANPLHGAALDKLAQEHSQLHTLNHAVWPESSQSLKLSINDQPGSKSEQVQDDASIVRDWAEFGGSGKQVMVPAINFDMFLNTIPHHGAGRGLCPQDHAVLKMNVAGSEFGIMSRLLKSEVLSKCLFDYVDIYWHHDHLKHSAGGLEAKSVISSVRQALDACGCRTRFFHPS